MGTMNVSLPDALRSFVDDQVASGTYGTSSEYVRDLIRRDRRRLELRNMILAGIASEPIGEIDASYWDAKRARVTRR
jgi:antitoxin ParD1/3/4